MRADAPVQAVADEHGHAPGVHAHQFDSVEQQHEAVTLGMWAFLVTEVLFFGALFASLFVYRGVYGQDFMQTGRELLHGPFPEAWHNLNSVLSWGAINTAMLLVSSLTMALAVRAAQLHRRSTIAGFLIVTMVLGAMFLGIKGIEYYDHIVTHPAFAPDRPPHNRLFYAFYFIMTGIHALHMIAGIGVMVWLITVAYRAPLNEVFPNRFEMAGLYWHFVDIVWIFLFPILYLSYH